MPVTAGVLLRQCHCGPATVITLGRKLYDVCGPCCAVMAHLQPVVLDCLQAPSIRSWQFMDCEHWSGRNKTPKTDPGSNSDYHSHSVNSTMCRILMKLGFLSRCATRMPCSHDDISHQMICRQQYCLLDRHTGLLGRHHEELLQGATG